MAHEAKQKAQNALIFLDIQQPLQRNKHQILQALETKAARKPNLPKQNVLNPDGPLLQALDQRINAYKKAKNQATTPSFGSNLSHDNIDDYLASTHEQIVISSISESKRSAEYESYSSHRRWMKDIWQKGNLDPNNKGNDVNVQHSSEVSDLDIRLERILTHMFDDINSGIFPCSSGTSSPSIFGNDIRPAQEILLAFDQEVMRNRQQSDPKQPIFLPKKLEDDSDDLILKDMFRLVKFIAKEGAKDQRPKGWFYNFAAEKASNNSENPAVFASTGSSEELLLCVLEYKGDKFAAKIRSKSLPMGLSIYDGVRGDGRVLAHTLPNLDLIIKMYQSQYNNDLWAVVFYCLRANYLDEALSVVAKIKEEHYNNCAQNNTAPLYAHECLKEVIKYYRELQASTSTSGNGSSSAINFQNFYSNFKKCDEHLDALTHNRINMGGDDSTKTFEWMCFNLACLSFPDNYKPPDETRLLSDKDEIEFEADDFQWHKLWFQYHLTLLKKVAPQEHFDLFDYRYHESNNCNLVNMYSEEFKPQNGYSADPYRPVEKAYIYMVAQDFTLAIKELAHSFPPLAIVLQNLCIFYSLIVPGSTSPIMDSPINRMLRHTIKDLSPDSKDFCLKICTYSLGLLDYDYYGAAPNKSQYWMQAAESEYLATAKDLLEKYLEFHKEKSNGIPTDFYLSTDRKMFMSHKNMFHECFRTNKQKDRFDNYLLRDLAKAPGRDFLADRVFFLDLSADPTSRPPVLRRMFDIMCGKLAELILQFASNDEGADRDIAERMIMAWFASISIYEREKERKLTSKFHILREFMYIFKEDENKITIQKAKDCLGVIFDKLFERKSARTIMAHYDQEFDLYDRDDKVQFQKIVLQTFKKAHTFLSKYREQNLDRDGMRDDFVKFTDKLRKSFEKEKTSLTDSDFDLKSEYSKLEPQINALNN